MKAAWLIARRKGTVFHDLQRGVKLALGRTLFDPDDPMGKMFFNILATFAEFEADLIRMRTGEGMAIARDKGKLRGKQPKLSDRQQGNSAACTPPASTPSAISPSYSPSQDQPSIAHSSGATPLGVRFCPLPESTPIMPFPPCGYKTGCICAKIVVKR